MAGPWCPLPHVPSEGTKVVIACAPLLSGTHISVFIN